MKMPMKSVATEVAVYMNRGAKIHRLESRASYMPSLLTVA